VEAGDEGRRRRPERIFDEADSMFPDDIEGGQPFEDDSLFDPEPQQGEEAGDGEAEDTPRRRRRERRRRPTRRRLQLPRRRERSADEPPGGVPRRRPSGETVKRIVVAIPWIVFAIIITAVGGPLFTAAMIGLGLIGLREFFLMARTARPFTFVGFGAVPALILAAHFGSSFNVLLVAACIFPVMFAFAADRDNREGVTISMAVTVLGIAWIGIPLLHAVLLRDLPLHGGALLIDVLVATFVTDTAAYATGRLFGSRRITPRLSPNKTLEGLIGGFVIGTMAFWFAGLYQDWLSGTDALIMGAVIAALAPVGDLFESMIKRDLDVKDTGNIFGPHGGLLDRLDAVFFTIVAGYYLAVAFVY
jgi:phosphatidate cytidylyltransferase